MQRQESLKTLFKQRDGEVCKGIHKEKKNSLLMFVGDGADSNEIKNYVKQLKLEEYTLFVGEKIM